MTPGKILLLAMTLFALAVIPADILYTSRFIPRFKSVEKQRIVTSNKLATAKIVSENLNHVRDLVYRNMEFSGQKDSLSQETILFDFLTSCVNDLKMRLVSVRPSVPTIAGRVTTYGYEIQLEGDFFSFGEFCSKLENSQRLLAITTFDVTQNSRDTPSLPVVKGGKTSLAPPGSGKRGILISMHLDTFRVSKG